MTRSNPPASNQVLHGDCIALMRDVPDNSAALCIADPPYNIGKDFGDTHDDAMPLSDYLEWTDQWLHEAMRIVMPDGLIYIYGYAEILAHIAVKYPIERQHWLVWHYKNKAVPSSKFWQRSSEMILCLWQTANRPNLNIDAIREPYSESFLNNAAGKTRAGTKGRFGKSGDATTYHAHQNGALPRDVLEVPALAGGAGRAQRWFYCRDCFEAYSPDSAKNHESHDIFKHPTQKPIRLTERLLDSCMKKGDKLLIPFAGSGSECVVAHNKGLDFIAFEANKDYTLLANSWLNKASHSSD